MTSVYSVIDMTYVIVHIFAFILFTYSFLLRSQFLIKYIIIAVTLIILRISRAIQIRCKASIAYVPNWQYLLVSFYMSVVAVH